MTTLWQGFIPVDSIDTVTERVTRVAVRAAKQGFPIPSLVLGEQSEQQTADGRFTLAWSARIEAEGDLKLGDYAFVGTVSSLADGTPFITYAPGRTDRRVQGVETVNYCDHCKTVRDRTNTYLVFGHGVYHQVGSSCILDFTGHDPAVIVGYLKAVTELSFSEDEVTGWFRSGTEFYRPDGILALAARVVAKTGYVSKAKAEEEDKQSTGEVVRLIMSAGPVERVKLEREFPESPDSHALFVATEIALHNKNGQGSNEWENDILVLTANKGVQWRHVGIVTSAIILGLRSQENKATDDRGESHFIGQKGDRLTFSDVTITLKRAFEGDYGTSFVIRMSVNESDDLLWFASWSEKTEALKEGDVITFTGTVKNHELDKRTERPTTVVTRCNIKEAE